MSTQVGPTTTPVTRSTAAPARPTPARLLEAVTARLEHPLAPYYLLIGATSMLLAIGLMEVLSASSVSAYEDPDIHFSYYWFLRQVVWVLLAVPAAWLVTRMPTRVLRQLAWPTVLISLGLVVLTQTPLGATINGNRNWVSFGGPLQIQPSELAKFSLILWCAHVYANKDRLLGRAHHILFPVLPVMMAMFAMVVVLGNDLGTGLILAGIALGMLWVVGAPMRLFVYAAMIGSVGLFSLAATSQERLSRMTSFLDPFQHYDDQGWQSGNGILGLASGGIFGKGIGASQQKWGNLPAPHTDFIFAVLGEELGLVGTLLVLALFLALIWSGIQVALRTSDPFVRYFSAGITIWLTVQTLINIGMVLALLPVIGVPLPLVSYGGSSLVPMLVSIAMLVTFARREPEAARALAAQG